MAFKLYTKYLPSICMSPLTALPHTPNLIEQINIFVQYPSSYTSIKLSVQGIVNV